MVADLGTDELRVYPVDETGRPSVTPRITALPGGSGPRTMQFQGPHLHVTAELSGTILTLAWAGDGTARLLSETATNPAHLTGQLSHIMAHDGRLLVGSRGRDKLLTMAPGSRPRVLGAVSTVASPRHLEYVNGYVIVAGQAASALGIHSIHHGRASDLLHEVTLPEPPLWVTRAPV